MTKRILVLSGVLAIAAFSPAWGADQGDKAAKGAVIGASTEVVGNAALDAATEDGQPDTPAQTAVKRAITGAVTGAAAAKLAGGPEEESKEKGKPASETTAAPAAPATASAESEATNPAGHHPPGWDRGKKTGWHGGKMPPGLAKKGGKK